jgi:hypothetical protein
VIWAAGLTRAEEDFEAVRAQFGSIFDCFDVVMKAVGVLFAG